MKTRVRTQVLWLLLMFLLSSVLAAQAAPFEINPLDTDAEGLVYTYWMSAPEKTLLIPVKARAEAVADTGDRCILLITHESFSEVQFAFFAFENRHMAQKDLRDYPDDEMQAVLATISSQPEALRFERYGEIASGVTAVWADEERDGTVNRHLVVFYQGWVYNAMAQSPEGKSIPQAAMDLQRQLMESLFVSVGPIQKTWVSGNVSLTVPDAFIVNQPEEGGEDYRFAYICPDETGPLMSLSVLYTIGIRVPAGVGMQDLSIAERIALLESAPLHPEEKITPLDVEGHPGIVRYTAGSEEICAALHNGTLLLAVSLPRDGSQQWEGDFRLAALNAMLGNQADWPTRVLSDDSVKKMGGELLIPSGGNLLTLAIPDGYSENIAVDEGEDKILGLESEDGPLYILRVMDVGAPIAPDMAEGAAGREATFSALSEALIGIAQGDIPDAGLKAEYLAESLLAQPGGRITDAKAQYMMLFCALDNSLITLSSQAEAGRLPENIQDILLDMLQRQ